MTGAHYLEGNWGRRVVYWVGIEITKYPGGGPTWCEWMVPGYWEDEE